MLDTVEKIEKAGFPIKVLDIGGGLGIDYKKDTLPPGVAAGNQDEQLTPMDLVDSIRARLTQRKEQNMQNFTLILEPGRSIIANAGVFVAPVIGVKQNGDKNFIVVDGSMCEVLRPSLYKAHHHVGFTSQNPLAENKVFDIVGPVCESADFLAQDRELPCPNSTQAVVVCDVGAYCFSMASNYNMRTRPAEYMVTSGSKLTIIRKAESFEDLIRLCIEADKEN